MNVLIGKDAEHLLPHVCAALNCNFIHPLPIAYLTPEGQAVCVLHNFNAGDVEIAMVGNGKWGDPEFTGLIADTVFRVNDCHRCTAKIRESNTKSWRAAERAGFVYEGTLRKAYHGEDIRVYGLLREECEYGTTEQTRQLRAASGHAGVRPPEQPDAAIQPTEPQPRTASGAGH